MTLKELKSKFLPTIYYDVYLYKGLTRPSVNITDRADYFKHLEVIQIGIATFDCDIPKLLILIDDPTISDEDRNRIEYVIDDID